VSSQRFRLTREFPSEIIKVNANVVPDCSRLEILRQLAHRCISGCVFPRERERERERDCQYLQARSVTPSRIVISNRSSDTSDKWKATRSITIAGLASLTKDRRINREPLCLSIIRRSWGYSTLERTVRRLCRWNFYWFNQGAASARPCKQPPSSSSSSSSSSSR
jgi:hypothetical protein